MAPHAGCRVRAHRVPSLPGEGGRVEAGLHGVRAADAARRLTTG
jgi:hypothetical protein